MAELTLETMQDELTLETGAADTASEQLQEKFAAAQPPKLDALKDGDEFDVMLPYQRSARVVKKVMTPAGTKVLVDAWTDYFDAKTNAKKTLRWKEIWGIVTDSIPDQNKPGQYKKVNRIGVIEQNRTADEEVRTPLVGSSVLLIPKEKPNAAAKTK